jgi:cation diffusion facilitator family transporter
MPDDAMPRNAGTPRPAGHSHVFLGDEHAASERRTWAVIWLCGAMMALEVVGGLAFGSIALVADGLHMSTHAGALLLAALAYRYARRHADDPRFTFGTGKLGDLAGFTSAIVLAMIAVLIGYESLTRLLAPVPIRFAEAIPIACLGLAVNIGSAWLLGAGHQHGHGHHGHGHHGHEHGHHEHQGHDEERRIEAAGGPLLLSVFEDGVPPVFRLRREDGAPLPAAPVTVETLRPDGMRQVFAMADRGACLESTEAIPEPHSFVARVNAAGASDPVVFAEHGHADGALHRDNNMRAAVVHVVADAAVSVLVIAGLLLARGFGWRWMDPLAGLVGAGVIASWAYGLIRDTGAILLDMNPDRHTAEGVRAAVEVDGDRLTDLHVWRLGPGHLGAIVSVATANGRNARFYRERLAQFRSLSHLTIEVEQG